MNSLYNPKPTRGRFIQLPFRFNCLAPLGNGPTFTLCSSTCTWHISWEAAGEELPEDGIPRDGTGPRTDVSVGYTNCWCFRNRCMKPKPVVNHEIKQNKRTSNCFFLNARFRSLNSTYGKVETIPDTHHNLLELQRSSRRESLEGNKNPKGITTRNPLFLVNT